jgi:perosamine synthetase
LKKLEANLVRRRQIAARYFAEFGNLSGVLPPQTRPDVNPAWHLYPIRLDLPRLSVGRGEVFKAVRAENIGVNVHYIPVHRHLYYRDRFGYEGGEYPVAEAAYECLISLPMFHGMTDGDIEDVVRALRKVLAHFGR